MQTVGLSLPRFYRFFIFLAALLGITASCFFGFIILFATENNLEKLLEKFLFIFEHLWVINIIVLMLITLFLYFLISQAYQRYVNQQFGIRLTIKLGAFFAIVAFVPSILLASVSYFYIKKSLVDFVHLDVYTRSFQASQKLNNVLFERLLNEQREYSFNLVTKLNPKENNIIAITEMLRELNQVSGLYNLSLVQSDNSKETKLLYGSLNQINNTMLEEAKSNRAYAKLETVDAQLNIRILLPLGETDYFLQVLKILPKAWANAQNDLSYAEKSHQQNTRYLNYLPHIYVFLLLLFFIFIVALTTLLAFMFSHQILQPLLMINDSSIHVDAEKNTNLNLAQINKIKEPNIINPSDELWFLSQAFNHMIARIHQERAKVQKSRDQLQAILASMSSGILVFDQNYKLLRYNLVAEEILNVPLDAERGKHIYTSESPLHAIFKIFGDLFEQNMRWEVQKEYSTENIKKYLLLRGSVLIYENTKTYILVFDDISQLISAEKSAAWAEVAQRLAHEIKNPLTPIQLSAERLQMKLQGKLDEKLEQIMQKSTDTIIQQVGALKYLVDEFRNYARLPQANFQAVDLNHLIQEVMQLYIATEAIDFKLRLEEGLPLVKIDPEQTRQVLHNLIKNAQEAMQGNNISKSEPAEIIIRTQRQIDQIGKSSIHLSIQDSGLGFAPQIIAKVFEPYITTKATGTGLGMAIVKKILDENHAKISINNRIDEKTQKITGAEIHIWFKLFDEEKREL